MKNSSIILYIVLYPTSEKAIIQLIYRKIIETEQKMSISLHSACFFD